MTIEKRIVLNNFNYYIGVELKYKDTILVTKENHPLDLGSFSIYIEDIEQKYVKNRLYDKDIPYMDDMIYILDRFPFLDYIRNITYDKENIVIEEALIKKCEIEEYIKQKNIKLLYAYKQEENYPLKK